MTKETMFVIGLLVGVTACLFIFRCLIEKLRTKAMERAAIALGFKFAAKGKDADTTNVVTGKSDDITIRISDRKWEERHSESIRTRRESRISLSSDLLQMPTFTITHEGIIAKTLTSVVGMQDIDFDSHPEFSKKYLLQCKNEEACRAYFTDSILTEFKIAKGVTVKGSGQTLLIYRSKRRIRPANLRRALEETFQIYSYFSD